MDQHFQILTPIDLIQTRTLGVNDTTYGANVFDPSHASSLLQGEWLYPTATYKVLDRAQAVDTVRLIANGPAFPVLDPRGQYDQQGNPGTYGGVSVAFAGATFEIYTDRICDAAGSGDPTNLTIGAPVGLISEPANVAGGVGATSTRVYLYDAAPATDYIIGRVIRPYDATTGYVGVLVSLV